MVLLRPRSRSVFRRSTYRLHCRCLALGVLTFIVGIGFQQASHLGHRSPEAILVLGGAPEREEFAAEFAQSHPDLPIWVSSGSNPEYAEWVFDEAQIDRDRIHLDYAAVDTVTNFTTLVDQLQAQQIDSVYLVTSDYHMRRAKVIGQIVLGSRGIDFDPIAIPTGETPERMDRAVRDGARSLLWLITGKTGSSLHAAPPPEP